jgi:bifunctional non-homologous end joining protein LigD
MGTAKKPLQKSAPDPLHPYRAKRNFDRTPEPAADGQGKSGLPVFVVQKHWASSLHYDFRLELDGTLKSWAVPKGPSYDPRVKRMAVQVEDHPLSYAAFEGTIPARQYGAGKVIVWDTGSWKPLADPRQGYRDGNLKFELHGHKLQGRWALVRMKDKGERQVAWLLIKEKDALARSSDDYSVVDEQPDSVKGLPPPVQSGAAPTPAATRAAQKTNQSKGAAALPVGAIAAPLPEQLAPQLATLVASPPADPEDWIHEIKFDGYRLLVRIDASGVRMLTRNGHDWTSKLRSLQQAVERLSLPPGWYDGEIVVLNEQGIPDFGLLQQSFDATRTDKVLLYLFDLPYFDGHDLRAVPLEARRALLGQVLEAVPSSERVRFSAVFDASAESVVTSACKLGLEGVIAKRRGSSYRSTRSADWIKLKCSHRQEFVIGGYTAPRGTRLGLGALLLGVHDADGVLQYAGNVGTGFNQKTLADLKKALDAKATNASPFPSGSGIEGRPHWVKPTLVAEVSFGEWTRAGRIRHAVFLGLRSDIDASTVVREKAMRRGAGQAPQTPAAPAPLSSRLRVTNPQRVIDASTGTTKLDMVRYYHLVGDLMMKHLDGRPVALVRAPGGIGGELFFQKHAETEKLPGLRQLDPVLMQGQAAMIAVASKRGLLSAAQWNVIELHTGNAVISSLDHPDRMVFDLDPGEGVSWVQVQEAAQLVHAFLGELGLSAFLKTSGGKGLHVVIPVRRQYGWDTVKDFSKAIVQHMAQTIPQRFVARSGPRNRVGKIFIDYLRNGASATTVSAWSARARPGLGISVPVNWDELASLRGGDHWRVQTVHERLDQGNQPWKGYARAARGLTAAMEALGFEPPEPAAKAGKPSARRRSKASR